MVQTGNVEKIWDDKAVVNAMVKLNLGKMEGNGLEEKMLLHIHYKTKKNINNTSISLDQWGNVKMNTKMPAKGWG